MNVFESLQFGQRTNGLPRSPLRHPDFIKTSQIQPELRTGAKEMTQTQPRVPGNAPPPIQYLGDAISRNPQLPRQPRRAHSQPAELLGQMSPGMNCIPCYRILVMVLEALDHRPRIRILL